MVRPGTHSSCWPQGWLAQAGVAERVQGRRAPMPPSTGVTYSPNAARAAAASRTSTRTSCLPAQRAAPGRMSPARLHQPPDMCGLHRNGTLDRRRARTSRLPGCGAAPPPHLSSPSWLKRWPTAPPSGQGGWMHAGLKRLHTAPCLSAEPLRRAGPRDQRLTNTREGRMEPPRRQPRRHRRTDRGGGRHLAKMSCSTICSPVGLSASVTSTAVRAGASGAPRGAPPGPRGCATAAPRSPSPYHFRSFGPAAAPTGG